MELYSEIGDRILVGKLVRKFINSNGHTEIKVDFESMKRVKSPSDMNIGWDEAWVVVNEARNYIPRIYYGPVDVKVLRKQYKGGETIIKQIVLKADCMREFKFEHGMCVSQADYFDFEYAKEEARKIKEYQKLISNKVVIKVSKAAMAKRKAKLAALAAIPLV